MIDHKFIKSELKCPGFQYSVSSECYQHSKVHLHPVKSFPFHLVS